MDLTAELARYGPAATFVPPSLDQARAYCRSLAQSHYENFTVASRLFPRHLRQHLCNVYAYCRWADDLADEASSPERSLALLGWWQSQLDDCFAHPTPHPAACGSHPLPQGERVDVRHPVFVALADTIREFELPKEPFADLLVAFRRDQTQTRYETFDELLGYCRYSANPVGRIVLHLGRSADAINAGLSDWICTGLQLANFCQDVARDWQRGRIYLPLAESRATGWDEAKFAAGQCDDAFRTLLQTQVERAERRLLDGRPLIERVHRDLRLSVRLFIEGGLAILAAIRRARYDVWSRRPTVGGWTKLRLLASAWWQG